MDIFRNAKLQHITAQRKTGNAASTVISPDDFAHACDEISQWEGYAATPLVPLPGLAQRIDVGQIHYKDEGPRFGLGSFKALGGSYAALRILQRELTAKLGRDVSAEDIRNGVYAKDVSEITLVSATDGNHGRSLAWGCQRFGAPCRIYIHAEVSEGRAQAMRDLGADVVRIKGDYDESVLLAKSEAMEHGWFVVSDTSWPGYSEPPRDVMAGYGMMTREICQTLPQAPTHVFLQGGVGGLAASVAAGLRQHYAEASPRVVIVEPDLAACLFDSARNGKATNFAIKEETIMAGLSCGEPSGMAWEILAEAASDFLTIPDTIIPPVIRMLARRECNDPMIEAGESAVAGLAAVIAASLEPALREKLNLDQNARILLIGSEGVTDPAIFNEIMSETAQGSL